MKSEELSFNDFNKKLTQNVEARPELLVPRPGEISEIKARELGIEVRIKREESMMLTCGPAGECYWNAYSLVSHKQAERYCLGFAAKDNRLFARHAWVKKGDSYLDNTRQGDGEPATLFVLVHEMSLSEIDAFYRNHHIDTKKPHFPIEITLDGALHTPPAPLIEVTQEPD